jgi:hypothetical protein
MNRRDGKTECQQADGRSESPHIEQALQAGKKGHGKPMGDARNKSNERSEASIKLVEGEEG